jgi:hypothetical protein
MTKTGKDKPRGKRQIYFRRYDRKAETGCIMLNRGNGCMMLALEDQREDGMVAAQLLSRSPYFLRPGRTSNTCGVIADWYQIGVPVNDHVHLQIHGLLITRRVDPWFVEAYNDWYMASTRWPPTVKKFVWWNIDWDYARGYGYTTEDIHSSINSLDERGFLKHTVDEWKRVLARPGTMVEFAGGDVVYQTEMVGGVNTVKSVMVGQPSASITPEQLLSIMVLEMNDTGYRIIKP